MINLTEETITPITAVIPRRKVGGWVAWIKQADSGWNMLYPRAPKQHWSLHPGCLYPTKDEAIKDATASAIEPTELKMFYLELET